MKKFLFLLSVLAFVTGNANAQLSVYPNGNVGIASPKSTLMTSTFFVKSGKTGYEIATLGTKRGICGESNGEYLNWSYGLNGKSNCKSASFLCGVSGLAIIPTAQSSSRTYGVMGLAGNATSGWNYGVFGQLDGTNYGAGVYGTATKGENGAYVDGRYAGYFNGATKVKGNLTVTGSISGVLLSRAPSAAKVSNFSYEYEKSAVTDKLSALSATCYYAEAPVRQAPAMESGSDTTSVAMPVSEIQALSADRPHYGLDIDQLKESFPELVYEQEDGTVGVNYLELIPILVQAINNLSAEVRILKTGGSYPNSESSTSGTTAVILNADGKVIGAKRAVSK